MSDDMTPVTASRSDGVPEWEVFCRESTDDALRHVGSVTAPGSDVAREQATTLFGHAARTLWLCRADDVERFPTRTLGTAHATEGERGSTTEGHEERAATEDRAPSEERAPTGDRASTDREATDRASTSGRSPPADGDSSGGERA
jgi:rSAM-partnered protein